MDKKYALSISMSHIFLIFPIIVIVLFIIPVLSGLIGTAAPAMGYFPALGERGFNLEYWTNFINYPGIGSALGRSIYLGLASAFIAFILSQLLCACLFHYRWFRFIQRGLSPILSLPHISLSLGIVFLFAPSGWLVRIIAPFFDIVRPLDLQIFPDPYGGALFFVLVLKETPFLLLMSLSAAQEIPTIRSLKISSSFGYNVFSGWFLTILPQIYRRLRLPIWAVLVFSISVVDMALVLLPNTKPTLGMLILRWYNDGDLSFQFLAAIGALLQGGFAVLTILLWTGGERFFSFILHKYYIQAGRRAVFTAYLDIVLRHLVTGISVFLVLSAGLSVILLAVWSFAGRWRFPDFLPSLWSLKFWIRHFDGLEVALLNALSLATISSGISVILTIGCLELIQQRFSTCKHFLAFWNVIIYMPLLVPQMAFLFGVQLVTVYTELDGLFLTVMWGHLLFVLPYVYLSLVGPYSNIDPRYLQIGHALGRSSFANLYHIRLPLLLRPILIAFAVGVAVSIAQYLPTLFLGGGRIETLTTEAVALSSGSDRRVIGVYAFVQAILPFIAFGIAALVPAWRYKNKLGMRGYR